MDRTEQYGNLVKKVIEDYAAFDPGTEGVEKELIFDDQRGHYELFYVGWQDWERVHAPLIHVDIRDGKIWIQHDGTEDGIVDELLEAGVPAEHIVLAWQHPFKRQFTEFAVG